MSGFTNEQAAREAAFYVAEGKLNEKERYEEAGQ